MNRSKIEVEAVMAAQAGIQVHCRSEFKYWIPYAGMTEWSHSDPVDNHFIGYITKNSRITLCTVAGSLAK